MNELKQTIRQIRPPLRIVAPMTFYTVLGYSIITILISINFQFIQREVPEMRQVGVLTIKMWAIVFVTYACSSLMLLALNEWRHLKRLLLLGIIIKSFFVFQLLSVAVADASPTVLSSVITWSFFAYLQYLNYNYFTPVKENDGRH